MDQEVLSAAFRSYRRRIPRKRLLAKAKLEECKNGRKNADMGEMDLLLIQLEERIREYGNLLHNLHEVLERHIDQRPDHLKDDMSQEYPALFGIRHLLQHQVLFPPENIEVTTTNTVVGYNLDRISESGEWGGEYRDFDEHFHDHDDIVKIRDIISERPNPVHYANAALIEFQTT
jgi:hypothetical protein